MVKRVMNKNKYALVFLCTPNTVGNIKRFYSYFDRYILPSQFVAIGNEKVQEIIEEENLPVKYINEDHLYNSLNYSNVKNALCARTEEKNVSKRTGWYFQQFLKMAYCMISEEDTYLVWDSDTIPTHNVAMYLESGKKVFDVKTEYHEPYFNTLGVLIPDLKKNNSYSFISEHMLIDKAIMSELIEKIEGNSNIEGLFFWEKIINAIEKKELGKSGFSEFETYGTFCEFFYPNLYEIRKWSSFREGTVFFENNLEEEKIRKLSKVYDAISFEKHESHMKLKRIFCHKFFQNLFWIELFDKTKKLLKRF